MALGNKTLLAALLATSVSTGAIAQSTNANENASGNAGVSAGANAGGASVGADVSAAAQANGNGNSEAGKQNYGQLIASLRTSGTAGAETITNLNADADITITLMSELNGEAAENAAALEQALNDQEENISDIRSEIEANAELVAALEAEGFTAEQVVAVQAEGSDEIMLVVNDAS